MRITYLGHAGFCVETERVVVVMDPWLSPAGAYDMAWFQFPRNHHLASMVRAKLADSTRDRFVYISHEHADHFDPEFLATLERRDFTLLVPKFRRDALRRRLAGYGSKALIAFAHGETVELAGGRLRFWVDDEELSRDSAVLMRADERTFFNLNDCKLYDAVPAIARQEGRIDVFAQQYSGATWHPTCYEYPRDLYERISRRKMLGKFEQVARAIDLLEPTTYLPSAGPACFLDPNLVHLNFEPVNIFPRSEKLQRWLQSGLGKSRTRILPLQPGDTFDPSGGQVEWGGRQPIAESDHDEYIRSYAAEYAERIGALSAGFGPDQAGLVFQQLRAVLQGKLGAMTREIPVPLYFGVAELPNRFWCVDFQERRIEEVAAVPGPPYYSVRTPAWQVARVLERRSTWEELALTFRVRLRRDPDVYRTELIGFLMLEEDALGPFCEKLRQIQSAGARLQVSTPCGDFAVDRYCPHQGADLAHAWVENERLLVCPRHRWQFDLGNGGRCLTSGGTINAEPVPETAAAEQTHAAKRR